MNEVMQRIEQIGIIPVIAIDDANKAVPLAKALIEGGIPAAEVTFRTAAGQEAIRQMSAQCPEMLVGAGTVLNEEQCDRALEAGAKFIVSPGYNESLVAYCQKKGVPVLPGCVNASDMTKAVNAGLEIVKFFPAEPTGGLPFLKSLAPVFPKLRFMPTGGVSTKNLLEYMSYDRLIACGGTWMVNKELIEGEQWEQITRICREAVQIMHGFTLHHIGINCGDEQQAQSVAKMFSALFGFEYKPGNSSVFAMPVIECMKTPGLGKNGHIAIGANNVERAVAYLKSKGVEFNEESVKKAANGRIQAIYLRDEIGGFAVHLVKK